MAPAEQAPASGLWKDFLNREAVDRIAQAIGRSFKKFDRPQFVDDTVSDDFFELELKERITRIAEKLKKYLPSDFKRATKILIKAAPLLGEFENWVLTEYIRLYGRSSFEVSVGALKELTCYGTSEFGIRPLIFDNTERMLAIFAEWVHHPNEHIRRLAAEGSRPRGVWVAYIPTFIENPQPVLDLLEHLRADPSLYVRKAVANNLNDISKDHPQLIIDTARRWQKDKNPDTDWIIKHGCRTLIKKGDPRVFPLLGFTENPKMRVGSFSTNLKSIKIGAHVEMTLRLESTARKTQRLAIDYRVDFARANGRNSSKVFKWSEREIEAGGTVSLVRRQSFRNLSTRKHHPGPHKITVIINGRERTSTNILLSK